MRHNVSYVSLPGISGLLAGSSWKTLKNSCPGPPLEAPVAKLFSSAPGEKPRPSACIWTPHNSAIGCVNTFQASQWPRKKNGPEIPGYIMLGKYTRPMTDKLDVISYLGARYAFLPHRTGPLLSMLVVLLPFTRFCLVSSWWTRYPCRSQIMNHRDMTLQCHSVPPS